MHDCRTRKSRSRKAQKQKSRKAEKRENQKSRNPPTKINGPPYISGVTPRTSTTNHPAMRPRVNSIDSSTWDAFMFLIRAWFHMVHYGFHFRMHKGTWSGPCAAAERSSGWPFLQDLDRTASQQSRSTHVNSQ